MPTFFVWMNSAHKIFVASIVQRSFYPYELFCFLFISVQENHLLDKSMRSVYTERVTDHLRFMCVLDFMYDFEIYMFLFAFAKPPSTRTSRARRTCLLLLWTSFMLFLAFSILRNSGFFERLGCLCVFKPSFVCSCFHECFL